MDWIKYAAIPGAVLAVIGIWGGLGFPTLATSGDIQRLDRKQAEAAVELYTTKQRSLLVIAPPSGTVAHDAWKEELETARRQLKAAEDRKIELSK